MNLSSAELVKRVVKANHVETYSLSIQTLPYLLILCIQTYGVEQIV